MKAREIQPCAICGKHPLQTDPPSITFHLVTFDRAVLDQQAARSTVGLAVHFGPEAAGLADIFSPDPEVVKVHPELRVTATLCERCMAEASIAQLWEAASEVAAEREEA